MYAGPRPSFAARVEDGDAGLLRRQPVGDLAGPVRRAVVDHEHPVVGPEPLE